MTLVRSVLAGAFLLAVLALAGFTHLLKTSFPENRVRSLVVDVLSRRFGREVRLDGVSVGLRQGISLEGFALSERSGFKDGTFLSAERISARPALLPLLRRRLVIRRLSLEAPEIRIVRGTEGRYNVSGLVQASTPSAGTSFPAVMAALGNRVFLRRGSVVWEDRAAGLTVTARDMAIDMRFLPPEGTVTVIGSARGEADAGRTLPLAWRAAVKARATTAEKGRLVIERLSFSADGAALDLRGTVRGWDSREADASVTLAPLEARALSPFADLPPLLADARAEGVLQIKGTPGLLSLSGDLTVSSLGVNADLGIDSLLKRTEEGGRLSLTVRRQTTGETLPFESLLPGPLAGHENRKRLVLLAESLLQKVLVR